MKKLLICIVLFAATHASAYNNVWQKVDGNSVPSKGTPTVHATEYAVYGLNTLYLKNVMFSLSSDPEQGTVIELPQPDGTFRAFKVWEKSMMEKGLEVQYPQIKTFTAVALDNSNVTAKLDFTLSGFHAMIFDGNNTSFIDPYSTLDDAYYVVHYKRNEYRNANERSICQFKSGDENGPAGTSIILNNSGLQHLSKIATGYQSRTYRLALACSNQYAAAATGLTSPTKANALSAMTTTMNRVNGVYEREFSITMVFVANESSLIFVTPNGDPYNNINTNANQLLNKNQIICDDSIGTANYDLGHVFTTAGGGLSSLGCICDPSAKAQSETGLPTPVGDGFDIDYVSHEMGHEYGGNHPFNNGSDGSCGGGNINKPTAYEPGSGSTIMAYAGICGPDDLQPHSDPYFHAISLTEIYNYSIVGNGSTCAVLAPTNNKPAYLPAFAAAYSIPYKTPFELTAPIAIDSVADTLNTYCWEQWNRGDAGKRLVNTHFAGPIFRSFNPDTSRTRVFPRLDSILVGTYSYASTGSSSPYENHEGEKVPDTARFLTFKLTERAIYQGYGSFLFPDDTVHLDVVNTGAPFAVTSQNTAGLHWGPSSTQIVTWNVVGTNTASISCDSVNIYLSINGGHSWPYLLGTFANTGTATVKTPEIPSLNTRARIKVKGNHNVFFNVNSKNFTVDSATAIGTVSNLGTQVKIYPSPATSVLNISSSRSQLTAVIYNELGQVVYRNTLVGNLSIPVDAWVKGIYYVQLTDAANGERIVKPVVVQ